CRPWPAPSRTRASAAIPAASADPFVRRRVETDRARLDPLDSAIRHREAASDQAALFALALRGLGQPEHLFALQQAHDLFVTYQRLRGECGGQMEAELAKQPNRAGDKPVPHKPRRCGRKKNDLRFAATGPLFRALGVDLTEIEGIDVGTALVIRAELGVAVS